MADLAASTTKINDVETAQGGPVSESTIQKVGGAINGLLDRALELETSLAATSKIKIAFTTITSGGSYTTPNGKQVFAAFANGFKNAGGSSGTAGGAAAMNPTMTGAAMQGSSYTFTHDSGGGTFATQVMSIGGASNSVVSLGSSITHGSKIAMIVYEGD